MLSTLSLHRFKTIYNLYPLSIHPQVTAHKILSVLF